jgi:hypothetical protein
MPSKQKDERRFEANVFSADGLTLVRVDKKSKAETRSKSNVPAGKRTKQEIVERLIDYVENEME